MPELTRELTAAAVTRGILSAEQADALWRFLDEEAPAAGPGFTFTNVLYYLGGLIALGAMTLFMTLGWESFGGAGIFAIATVYAALALGGCHWLRGRGLTIPAGLLAALAIGLVPLAIYGLESALGAWPEGRAYRDYHQWIDWRWIWMELGSLLAGTLVLYFYRFPFAVLPLAMTLWYMSMDFAMLLAQESESQWQARQRVSMVFGLVMIALSFYIDYRSRRRPDFGFWLSLFGVLIFWGALSSSDSTSQWAKAGYAAINVALIFLGAVTARRAFTVFGAIGFTGYLGYLSYNVWKDSMVFPFVLTAIGLGIIAGGIVYQRREAALRAGLLELLPPGLRRALPE